MFEFWCQHREDCSMHVELEIVISRVCNITGWDAIEWFYSAAYRHVVSSSSLSAKFFRLWSYSSTMNHIVPDVPPKVEWTAGRCVKDGEIIRLAIRYRRKRCNHIFCSSAVSLKFCFSGSHTLFQALSRQTHTHTQSWCYCTSATLQWICSPSQALLTVTALHWSWG